MPNRPFLRIKLEDDSLALRKSCRERVCGSDAINYRFIADGRDWPTGDRFDDLKNAHRLFRCGAIMNCTEVCPKGLAPSRVIENIRLMIVNKSA